VSDPVTTFLALTGVAVAAAATAVVAAALTAAVTAIALWRGTRPWLGAALVCAGVDLVGAFVLGELVGSLGGPIGVALVAGAGGLAAPAIRLFSGAVREAGAPPPPLPRRRGVLSVDLSDREPRDRDEE